VFTVRQLPEFSEWLNRLTDKQVRSTVIARIKRLGLGLLGDAKPVGGGVSELRIHQGPGWRLYFTRRGTQVVVLLLGGSKRTQQADIKRAIQLAELLDDQENEDEKAH
jgi:putative addiction module killer protein